MKAFLAQNSLIAGKTNAALLGWDINDPFTWQTGSQGMIWSGGEVGTLYNRVDAISFDANAEPVFKDLGGYLNLTYTFKNEDTQEFEKTGIGIGKITVRGTGITGIDISGNPLTEANLEDNKLTEVIAADLRNALQALNLQNNRLTKLDLTESRGVRSANLRGFDMTGAAISALPKVYPFSLYYGSGRAGNYFALLEEGGAKIEVTMNGNPNISMVNRNFTNMYGLGMEISSGEHTLLDDPVATALTPYFKIIESQPAIYEVMFLRNTEPSAITRDISATMNFSSMVIKLPEHIFSHLLPPVAGKPLETSVPETNLFKFEVSWSPNDIIASADQNYELTIKAVPKANDGSLDNADMRFTDSELWMLFALLRDDGVSAGQGANHRFDPESRTFSATASAELRPNYAMGIYDYGAEIPVANIAQGVQYRQGGQDTFTMRDFITVKNESDTFVGVIVNVVGHDDKFRAEARSAIGTEITLLEEGEFFRPQIIVDFNKAQIGVYNFVLEVKIGLWGFNEQYVWGFHGITKRMPATVSITEDTPQITVTTAAGLSAALQSGAASIINLGADITLDRAGIVVMGAAHTLKVGSGRTLTISDGADGFAIINIGANTLNINGGGNVTITREDGHGIFTVSGALNLENIKLNLKGPYGININTVNVNSGASINVESETARGAINLNSSSSLNINGGGAVNIDVGGGTAINNNGTIRINNGGRLSAASEENDWTIDNGGLISLSSGGVFTGSGSGGVYMQRSSRVEGMAGMFSDRGVVLTANGSVRAGANDALPAADGLSNGLYTWNGRLSLFARPGPVSLPGDINGDGDVNILDVNMLYQFVRGIIQLTEAQQLAADVNGDGEINILDVNMLYQFVRGIINSLY